MKAIHKSASIEVTGDSARFIASSATEDRYGDTVQPRGIDTTNFASNPVILFGHKSSELPVAKATRTWVDEQDRFMVDVEFMRDGVDAFADKVKTFVKEGFLNAVSIGFIPVEQKARHNKDGEFLGYNFLKSEILEISIVPIPALAGALQVAKSLHFSQKDMSRLFTADSGGTYEVENARKSLENLKLRLSG